jgi:glutaminase
LANHGRSVVDQRQVVSARQSKQINALLATCGLYDEAGEFAYRVGLPGKSGVGGGIVAVIPGELSICVWSPELNTSGNSLAGCKALELFTTSLGKSIY